MSSSYSDTCTVHNVPFGSNFTLISNAIFEHAHISWDAKALLCYILSRPPNWKVHTWQLAEIYKGEKRGNGLDGIKSMFKELREAGYIVYTKTQNEDGKWNHRYDTYPMPYEEFKKIFPEMVKPAVVQPAVVKPSLTINTELPNTELTVCTVPEAPPAVERFCTKVDLQGKSHLISLDDLFTRCVQERKEWTEPEIHEAWTILCNYKNPVSDWFHFIEGTIKKISIKKQNTQHKVKKCNLNIDNQGESKKRKSNYSEKDMSEPILANFARQIGLSNPS